MYHVHAFIAFGCAVDLGWLLSELTARFSYPTYTKRILAIRVDCNLQLAGCSLLNASLQTAYSP